MVFPGFSTPSVLTKTHQPHAPRVFVRLHPVGQWIGIFFILLLGSACAPAATTPGTPSITPTLPLRLYQSSTPSPTAVQMGASPVATLTPLPSPTPFTYTIEKDDTLLTIAFRFGVTVDEIMAVNPGVDPRILSIGTTLIIPLGEAGGVVIPTATPVPLLAGQPRCYQTAGEGLWCFIPVLNELSVGMEGVSGEISIYEPGGELSASLRALPPLDILPPGKVLPLYANFPPPIPEGYSVAGKVTGAFLTGGDGDRYFPVGLFNLSTAIHDSGLTAEILGEVLVGQAGEGEASRSGTVVVAAVAYDSRNEVAGLRLWEQAVPAGIDEGIGFELQVFSLGPPITSVEVFVEGRADPPSE